MNCDAVKNVRFSDEISVKMIDRYIEDLKEEELEINAQLEELVKDMDLAVKLAGNMGGTLGDDVMSTYWPQRSSQRQPEIIMEKKLISYSACPISRDATLTVYQQG